MKKEKSCGAVIFTHDKDGELLYLIQHMSLGHTSLCKGHVEGDETEVETANREIMEETSLKVAIDTGFRHVITYSPNPGIMKDVVFFVAKSEGPVPIQDRHDREVASEEWLPFPKALDALTYETDKETLFLADTYIRKNGNIK